VRHFRAGVIHHLLLYVVVLASIGGLVFLLIFTRGGGVSNPFNNDAKVELTTEYQNPFEKDTQYENPFEEYKNPLLSL